MIAYELVDKTRGKRITVTDNYNAILQYYKDSQEKFKQHIFAIYKWENHERAEIEQLGA